MDGSGRVSQRNRRHLQKIRRTVPEIPHIPSQARAPTPAPEESTGNNIDITNDPPVATHEPTVPSDAHFVRRSERLRRQPDWYRNENYVDGHNAVLHSTISQFFN